MGKTKKQRKKEKQYEMKIKAKRLLKTRNRPFRVVNPWPGRGCRSSHFRDEDAFENALWNYFRRFKYPLD